MKSERLRNWSEVPGLATEKESYGSPGLISQPTLSTTLRRTALLQIPNPCVSMALTALRGHLWVRRPLMPGRGRGCRPLTSQQGCSWCISRCITSGAGLAYWTTGTSPLGDRGLQEGREGVGQRGGEEPPLFTCDSERGHRQGPWCFYGAVSLVKGTNLGGTGHLPSCPQVPWVVDTGLTATAMKWDLLGPGKVTPWWRASKPGSRQSGTEAEGSTGGKVTMTQCSCEQGPWADVSLAPCRAQPGTAAETRAARGAQEHGPLPIAGSPQEAHTPARRRSWGGRSGSTDDCLKPRFNFGSPLNLPDGTDLVKVFSSLAHRWGP